MTTKTAAKRDVPVLDPDLRARVADFLADYAHAIDDDRLEEWPGYFTADALYHITTRESDAAGLPIGIMHCRGRGMLEDRIKALRTANIFEPHSYCHILGATRLVDQGASVLSARTNFTVTRTMQDGGTDALRHRQISRRDRGRRRELGAPFAAGGAGVSAD